MDIIRVHTNFNNAPTRTHEITLATLDQPRNLEILRNVFFEPDKLRPGVTSEAITEKASGHFAEIAESMRQRGLEPQSATRLTSGECEVERPHWLPARSGVRH